METGRFGVVTDLAIARDRRNLAVRAFELLHPADGFEFRIRSDVPLSGGLGSSAAAIVAGLLAADSMFELDADLLALATRMEGHPDNVAAALLGGFVICADGRAERFDAPAGLEAVLVVPHEPVRTAARARGAAGAGPDGRRRLQRRPRRRCSCSASRAATGTSSRAGCDDRLHQPHREHLYPRSMALVRRARELGALGATISGAGPTVLVWCAFEATGAVLARAAGGVRGLGGGPARAVRAAGRRRARALGGAAR